MQLAPGPTSVHADGRHSRKHQGSSDRIGDGGGVPGKKELAGVRHGAGVRERQSPAFDAKLAHEVRRGSAQNGVAPAGDFHRRVRDAGGQQEASVQIQPGVVFADGRDRDGLRIARGRDEEHFCHDETQHHVAQPYDTYALGQF